MSRYALALSAAVLALLVGIAAMAQRELNSPLKLPATGHELIVAPGTSLRSLAGRLEAEGILSSALVLTTYGRLSGQASRLQAGEYEVVAGTTPLGLLQQLVEGRVRLHTLTIIEGWTIRELMRAVRKHPAIKHTLKTQDAPDLARTLQLGSESPEGWFFPDTYKFPRGTTDIEILTRAHDRMRVVLDQAWSRRRSDLPLRSAYEALILASIVEKETALDREKTRVAGVFARRLQSGMRLQTDPTVIYGLGEEFDGNLTRRQLGKDTPYNTYLRPGLPPSPISMPGESSLLAAVHPDDSRALYFVASGEDDGSHVFSETLREHNAAVKKYLSVARENVQ
jgi:UPF0755 protein